MHVDSYPKFKNWFGPSDIGFQNHQVLKEFLYNSRNFQNIPSLDYGDFGLEKISQVVLKAIQENKRIALYADYDVDGTMSCVSWIWFFQAVGFLNFISYIPCRFKEGYGLNLNAVKHLVHEEKADLIITMDTGITANEEASYCKEHGVIFICTDHHKIQIEKMPDCLIMNPKLHSDPNYQELCGCGVSFVLLRKLGKHFSDIKPSLWLDLLALAGIATICDLVPLNPVNHQIARKGVQALSKSERPVIKALLREAMADQKSQDEKDIGFRIGPRINAVGRLEHADLVISAFVENNFESLIKTMSSLNEKRKQIQKIIVKEAQELLQSPTDTKDSKIVFLGGDWHPGVVGIAASKISESYWKPTWLFQKQDGIGKGSARSIPGFDVTECMTAAKNYFKKFGGHAAAGGFSFDLSHEEDVKNELEKFSNTVYSDDPKIWESKKNFDAFLDPSLLNLNICDLLDDLKPFGQGFSEPIFLIKGYVTQIQYFLDKQNKEPRHTCIHLGLPSQQQIHRVMFFNEVVSDEFENQDLFLLVSIQRNFFMGRKQLSIQGIDLKIAH